MNTIAFANQTGSNNSYALDIIINGQFGTRLSAVVTDGIQTINIKRAGTKIATRTTNKGHILSQDEVRAWAKEQIA